MRLRALVVLCAILAIGAGRVQSAYGDSSIGSIPGSFDVSLSGSSSYSIPIKIAPGAAGTQPQILLNYDSQTLGGPVGAGWYLSGFSAITRGPRDKFVDGHPGAINLDEQDALFLDGQRLVPVNGPIGTGATRQIEYRKVNDDFTEVVQFGPDLNHSYFRARTKGGVTLIFGNPAIIATPSAELDATIKFFDKSVVTFAESAVVDTAGNFIAFHYQSNNYGDYNIVEVDYTGHGSIDNNAVITKDRDPFASVTFVYGPAPRPIELYVAGQIIKKDKRLTDIYSCVSNDPFVAPFDCKVALSGNNVHQISHYKIDYDETETSNRFVARQIHMFGANDGTEISPTKFTYSTGNLGWDQKAIALPDGLILADTEKIARGYRFAHFAPDTTGTLDLLFSAQIGGKNVAYAFKNNGPSSWSSGGQPWSPASKNVNIPPASTTYDFEPPVPFVSEDGGDLGVILADITNSGRTAIIQSSVVANQESKSAYLAGPTAFEIHNEYEVPFVVSKDGKVVAQYRFANWTGGIGPDLIYDSDGKKGFLKNGGTGSGWQPLGDYEPPIALDVHTHLMDLDCSGGPPALIGAAPDGSGKLVWKVYRFGAAKWELETDPKFEPLFPASTNPEAVREVRFDGRTSSCAGLIVATAEGGGLRKAMVPSADGWKEVPSKLPIFDLVDANGNPSKAVVANLKGDGYDGIVANTVQAGNKSIAFAFTQDAGGWHDDSANFVPNAFLDSDDPNTSAFSFVGAIVGQGGDDIAILNNQRVTASDIDGKNRQFGKFYTNDGTRFVETTSFAPPIPFAAKDKKDLGVRFVDLHGTGLPDVVFSRMVTEAGKTYLVSGAYRNTGRGWVPEPGQCTDSSKSFDTSDANPPIKEGLCPPVPFAGADITGNPSQFVDLDGDGYVDLIYGYKDKGGNIVTKVYFNVSDGQAGRKWVDYKSDLARFEKFVPPDDALLLASSGIGDLGVRFAKFDTNRIGALLGFRPGKCIIFFRKCIIPIPDVPILKAYVFNGTKWEEKPQYAPSIPFVTQYDSPTGHSIDLFVQLMDINGSGMPAMVANFTDPVTQQATNQIWQNTGSGWALSPIKLPYRLDAVYWETKTLVQIADANGDGLPDVVMTKGDSPSNSKTWLGTGKSWVESPNWQVPADAISKKDGEPGFRLVDTKGDGYLDVLWMRPDKDDGTPDRGLALNNGHDWHMRADSAVPKNLFFADKDGVDQGIRLLSVTGKGLTDIVASFEGHLQEVDINRARRADILTSATDGYGIKTNISYQTLLEYDGSDSASGVKSNPLGWRVYERETPDAYPKVAPVPTMYVVRQATVDEGDGLPPVTIDYRYGKYQVDAEATRSLGFGWRESLNEYSHALTRSEMIQDARARPGVAVETSCVTDTVTLNNVREQALKSKDLKDRFPLNLCPSGKLTAFKWGYKISETETCWTVIEGDLQGNVNDVQLPTTGQCGSDVKRADLSGFIIRQSAVSKSTSTSFEIDGQVISEGTNAFVYDTKGDILHRHGNAISTVSALKDGSSVETENEFDDDPSRWFLGRLTKTTVVKRGDLVNGGPERKSETRCSSYLYDSHTGLLSDQIVNCDNPKSVTTHFHRDGLGNIDIKTVSAAGEKPQIATSVFDKFGRFEILSIDALGHGSAIERDSATGQVLTAKDANGLTGFFKYDGFGRLRQQVSPTGIITSTDLIDTSLPDALPKLDASHDISFGLNSPTKYAVKSQIGELPPTWALFDSKGREIRQVGYGYTPDGTRTRLILKETVYDSLGRTVAASLPHDASDNSPNWSFNEYDSLGRVCASTSINGLRTETLFQGRPEGGGIVTVSVDPKEQLESSSVSQPGHALVSCGHEFDLKLYRKKALNQISTSIINMRKETIQSADALGKVIFEYDAGGRVEKMMGSTGATTSNVYDELGNKITVTDPDLGTWHYVYDAFGRVTKQTDTKNQLSTMEYDLLGRPKRRNVGDASTIWEYDSAAHGVGALASTTNSNGYREEYFYDEVGRLQTDAVTIDDEHFATGNDYDAYGRTTKVTYPNAFAVENVYDKNGFFISVKDAASANVYWTGQDFDVFGRVIKEKYGNGVVTTKQFDPTDERLRRISATNEVGSRVLDLSLDYDLIGNLKQRSERVAHKKESFGYDELNRLIAVVSAENGQSKFKYDAAGRMTYKTGAGVFSYPEKQGQTDGDTSKPYHAVLKTAVGRSGSRYKYDLNGNMIKAPGVRYEYTSDNHLKLLYHDADKWERFDYGPSGDRFRQFSRIGAASEETIYLGMFERVVDYSLSVNSDYFSPAKFSGFERNIKSLNYIANGMGTFAIVETIETYANNRLYNPGGDQNSKWFGKLSNRKTQYFNSDQLGSILRVTDQNGKIRDKFWYDAWGARSGSNNDAISRGFTGHEHLDAFGLIHMNGRVYNPTLAKFLTVDPLNQMNKDTQSGNGYSYARNNPLRYIDPSGFSWLSDAWDSVTGAASDLWHGVTHFAGEVGKWFNENWKTLVVVAVVVVVTVLTMGTATAATITLGQAILVGAAAGAAGSATATALYGGSPDEILQSAIKGAIIGGISAAAFYGVGSAFSASEATSTTTQVETMAAHGVVGGAKSAAEGGDFWKGFVATAATKASSLYGPDFNSMASNVSRAAVVGGTVAQLTGGKFANGAVTGAFSYAFNDFSHKQYLNERYVNTSFDSGTFRVKGLTVGNLTNGSFFDEGGTTDFVSIDVGEGLTISPFATRDAIGVGFGLGFSDEAGALGGHAEVFVLVGSGRIEGGAMVSHTVGLETTGYGGEAHVDFSWGGAALRAYQGIENQIKSAVGFYNMCPECQ